MGHSAVTWDHKACLELTEDWNGIKQAVLRNAHGASARVSLHGGQVVSWRNEKGEELLFTSKAICKFPKVMRGGISIFFPQFGNCALLKQHGFVKNKIWAIDENSPPLNPNYSVNKSSVDLVLKQAEEDMKSCLHGFEFRLRVSVASDGNLVLTSRIRNINGKPFSFSFAYHTYLSISDISEVRIEGLETLDYLDNLCGRERFTEQGDAITFESELSPVCCDLGSAYFTPKAVWNPWEKKSKAMLDLGDDEYKQMVCVNGAAIERNITLKPGEEWRGSIELAAVPSSFCAKDLDPRLNMF